MTMHTIHRMLRGISLGLLLAASPAVFATETEQPLLIINGHHSLTSEDVLRLEEAARQLGTLCQKDESAVQQMCMVLVQPNRGLFKRAIALRALFYAGYSHQALRIVETHDDLPLLELITSTLATHGYQARAQ